MALPVVCLHTRRSPGRSAVPLTVPLVMVVPMEGAVAMVVVATGSRSLQRHRGHRPGTMPHVVRALVETQRAPPGPGQEGQDHQQGQKAVRRRADHGIRWCR